MSGGPSGAADTVVLLATFNGERYLREQIESILQQEVAVRIVARDDGSSDGTAAILKEYAARADIRFAVLSEGVPSGSAKGNFLDLLKAVSADYLCFADQDDVWLPGKVISTRRAMLALEATYGTRMPLLVFTDLRVTDEHLVTVQESLWAHLKIDPATSEHLQRLLGQTVVTGCTMMINRAMRDLAIEMPEEASMHDHWIGLLAAALGRSTYLDEQTVLYRQHAHNLIGAAAQDGSLAGVARRTISSAGRREERARCQRQASALLRIHASQMEPGKVKILEAYLRSGRDGNPLVRVFLTLRYGFMRGSLARTLALLADLLGAPVRD